MEIKGKDVPELGGRAAESFAPHDDEASSGDGQLEGSGRSEGTGGCGNMKGV